jgi:hypothetical protein
VLDLASANYLSHDASVLLGRAMGRFGASFAAGTGPVSLTSGDFNSDDRLDLGVASSNSDDLTCSWAAEMDRSQSR